MMQLTGPPKINGTVFPYASDERPMDVRWKSEYQMKEYQDGTQEVLRRRFRAQIRCVWRGLSYAEAEALLAELNAEPVDLVARTAGAGDGYGSEVEIACRVVSDLPSTDRLVGRVFDLDIELESLGLFDRIPGLGLLLLTSDEEILHTTDEEPVQTRA